MVHPAVSADAKLGCILVGTFCLQERESIPGTVQVVNLADLVHQATITRHREDVIGRAIAEQQGPGSTQRGHLGKIPAIGIDEIHAIAWVQRSLG